MKKKYWLYLFISIFLSFLLNNCVTNPPSRLEELGIIKDDLFNELNGKEIIIWDSGTRFIDLNIDDRYKLQDILLDPISKTTSEYVIKITYILNNGREDVYKDYSFKCSNYGDAETFISGCIRQLSRPIGEFDDNVDVIEVARGNILLIYNSSLKLVYNNKLKENGENFLRNENVNKLIALLINPMAIGYFGQFTQGETVYIKRSFLRIIDLQQSEDTYIFLVMVNDNKISKPFYITSKRMFNIMDIGRPNTIFEDFIIEYVGSDNYLYNGVPRETFVFQLLH